MAAENLKYDLELSTGRAEKTFNDFMSRAEGRLNSLEKKLGNALGGGRPSRSSGGRSGSSSYLRDWEQENNDEKRAESKRLRTMEHNAREELKIENFIAREKERGRRQRAKAQRDVSQGEERQRKEDERYLNSASTKYARIHSIDQVSESRKEQIKGRGARFADDAVLQQELLAAQAKFENAKLAIMKDAAQKGPAITKAALDKELAQFNNAVSGLNRTHSDNQNSKAARAAKFSKFSMFAFQGQQIIEDASYAGWRGISNNLAFMGSMLGGATGLAVVAGVAAKGLWDLGKAMFGVSDGAEEMAANVKQAVAELKALEQMQRNMNRDTASFRPAKTSEELSERRLGLKEDREAIIRDNEITKRKMRDLESLKKLQEQFSNLPMRDKVAHGSIWQSDAQNKFYQNWRNTRKSLQNPAMLDTEAFNGWDMPNISQVRSAIAKLQEEIGGELTGSRTELVQIANKEKLNAESEKFVNLLEQTKKKNDELLNSLKDQLKTEEDIVRKAKERIEALGDAKFSHSTSSGGKWLDYDMQTTDTRVDKQIKERQDKLKEGQQQEFKDRSRAEEDFMENQQRMLEQYTKSLPDDKKGVVNDAFGQWQKQRGRAFEDFMDQRSKAFEQENDRIQKEGEKAANERNMGLIEDRKSQLGGMAAESHEQAQAYGDKGDIEKAQKFMDRYRDLLSEIQDLTAKQGTMGEDWGAQDKFIEQAKAIDAQIQSSFGEEANWAQKLEMQHERAIQFLNQEVEAAETRKTVLESTQWVKEQDLAALVQMNVLLDAAFQTILAINAASLIAGGVGMAIPGMPAGLPGRAAGGSVNAGMPYIVGERGQELFIPQSSGTIFSHADTQRIMANRFSGPSVTNSNRSFSQRNNTVIHTQSFDMEKFTRVLAKKSKSALNRLGGNA